MSEEKSKWMIRDCKHGKVFSFDSFEEMCAFVLKLKEQLN